MRFRLIQRSGPKMGICKKGDFVKVVFKDDDTGESERMWVRVDSSDDDKRVVFGRLDNEPIAVFVDKLWLGKELAVSYDLIQEVMKEHH